MDNVTSLPGRAYDYVYGNYGTIGLIVAVLGVVVAFVGVTVWFDRRK